MSNIASEDLRSIRTEKALCDALFTLLNNLSFKKITIKEICEEALISRATFYSHYIDKYDLLEHWITQLWEKDLCGIDSYEQMEKVVNFYVQENTSVLKNLISDADNETISVLFDFILSTIDLSIENSGEELFSKNIVLSSFYAGGIISYLSWHVRNRFPSDVPPMNRYLYKMIQDLKNWQSK